MEKSNYILNIEEFKKKFEQKISHYISKRKIIKKIDNPCLLVCDMQKYFTNPNSHAFVPASKGIIEPILELVEIFENKGYPVIYTRHTNTPGNAGMMSVWWNHNIDHESEFALFDDRIDTGYHPEIEKHQYDAFYETNLDRTLKRLFVKDLVVCGVMTNLCCETTVRSAFVNAYRPIFPFDTTATINFELHVATFKNLGHGFTNPTDSYYLKELL